MQVRKIMEDARWDMSDTAVIGGRPWEPELPRMEIWLGWKFVRIDFGSSLPFSGFSVHPRTLTNTPFGVAYQRFSGLNGNFSIRLSESIFVARLTQYPCESH